MKWPLPRIPNARSDLSTVGQRPARRRAGAPRLGLAWPSTAGSAWFRRRVRRTSTMGKWHDLRAQPQFGQPLHYRTSLADRNVC